MGVSLSGNSNFQRAHFSDTLLLWTNPITNEGGYKEMEEICFFHTVGQIVFNAFINGIPLRAGIGFGECYVDRRTSTYLGPAIVDAYEVEAAQEWIGAALHPNCPIYRIPHRGHHYRGQLVRYQVPTKTESRLNLETAIDWTELAQLPAEFSVKEFGMSFRQELEQSFEEYLKLDLPAEALLKYSNAQKFVKKQITRELKRRARGGRYTRELLSSR
jgi:hypothetical protein